MITVEILVNPNFFNDGNFRLWRLKDEHRHSAHVLESELELLRGLLPQHGDLFTATDEDLRIRFDNAGLNIDEAMQVINTIKL